MVISVAYARGSLWQPEEAVRLCWAALVGLGRISCTSDPLINQQKVQLLTTWLAILGEVSELIF